MLEPLVSSPGDSEKQKFDRYARISSAKRANKDQNKFNPVQDQMASLKEGKATSLTGAGISSQVILRSEVTE